MSDYRDWVTLREIDAAAGVPKGTAFRCFKHLAPSLDEERDYVVLDHLRDREAIAALRSQARLYRSSVNVVLLRAAAAQRLAAALSSAAPPAG